MAFAKAPNSCELNRQMQRNVAVQVKPHGADSSQYKFVRGLTSAQWVIATQDGDTTDIDSNGFTTAEKVSRGFTLNLDGTYLIKDNIALDEVTRLLQYTGEELGYDGLIDFRAWRTDFSEGWEGTANNTFTPATGDANAHRKFTSALAASCEPTRIESVEEGAEREDSVPMDMAELLAVIRPAPAPGG